jgi:hypothetical protein
MADSEPPRLSVNDIDLSQFMTGGRFDYVLGTVDPLAGSIRAPEQSFTITGYFDDGRSVCPLCAMRFAPPPPPQLTPFASANGTEIGPICDACAMQLLDP